MTQPTEEPHQSPRVSAAPDQRGQELSCKIPGVELFEHRTVIHGIDFPRLHGGPSTESAESFENDVITNLDAEMLQFVAVCRVLGEVGCIQGAAGFGKTHTAERLSWLFNQNIFSANGAVGKPGEVIGRAGLKTTANSGVGYIPGWATLALGDPESRSSLISGSKEQQADPAWLSEGGILFLDEFNASDDVVRRRLRQFFEAVSEQRPRLFIPEDNYRAHQVDSNFSALIAVNEVDPSNPALRRWNKSDFVRMVHFICPTETPEPIKKQRLSGLMGRSIMPDNLDDLRLVRNPGFTTRAFAAELKGAGVYEQYCERLFQVMDNIHQMSERKQIGSDKRQPVFFDAIRNTDRILRFATAFYNYDPEDITRKALRFFYTNMFEAAGDKAAVNEVVDSFTLERHLDPDRILFQTIAMPAVIRDNLGFTADPAPAEQEKVAPKNEPFDKNLLAPEDLRVAQALPNLTARLRNNDCIVIGTDPPDELPGTRGSYYAVKTSEALGLNSTHVTINRDNDRLILTASETDSENAIVVKRSTGRVSTYSDGGRIRIGAGDSVEFRSGLTTKFSFDVVRPFDTTPNKQLISPYDKSPDANEVAVLANRCRMEISQMLSGDSIILGRHPTQSDMEVPLGSASRQHCRITVSEDPFAEFPYKIEDLESRNGTLVDDDRIVGELPATAGSIVQISDLSISLPDRTAGDDFLEDDGMDESVTDRLVEPDGHNVDEESLPFERTYNEGVGPVPDLLLGPAAEGREAPPEFQEPGWMKDAQDLRRSTIPGIHIDDDARRVSFMGANCQMPDAVDVNPERIPALTRAHKTSYARDERLLMQTIAASWELGSTPCVVAGTEFDVHCLVEFMANKLQQESYSVTGGSDPVIHQFRKMIPSEDGDIGFKAADGPIGHAMRRGGILVLRDYEAMSPKNRIFLRDLFSARLNGRKSLSNSGFPGEEKSIPIHPLFRPVIIASPIRGSTADALPLAEPDFSRVSYISLGQQPSTERLRAEPRLRLGEVFDDDFLFEEVLNTHSAIDRQAFNEMIEQSGILDAFTEAYTEFKHTLQQAASPAGYAVPGYKNRTIRLGEDNREQPVYTGDTRDDIMFLEFARVFYDGSLLKSLRQATSYKFGNWFASTDDKRNVRRLFQRALATTPLRSADGQEIPDMTLYKKLQQLRDSDGPVS